MSLEAMLRSVEVQLKASSYLAVYVKTVLWI